MHRSRTTSPFIYVIFLANIIFILFDYWNRYCNLDAFNCDNLPNKKWNVDAVYYTSKSDQLSEVIKFVPQDMQKESSGLTGWLHVGQDLSFCFSF